mmetsp:Transcript_71579/g.99441  ORF Transcript_71579/g.99441 Transcript_71579/m.99441 type:complete len:189 (-) Transcript_71579:63-629(-)
MAEHKEGGIASLAAGSQSTDSPAPGEVALTNRASSPGNLQRVNCLDADDFRRLVRNLYGLSSEDSGNSGDGPPVCRTFGIVPDGCSSFSPCGSQEARGSWTSSGVHAATAMKRLCQQGHGSADFLGALPRSATLKEQRADVQQILAGLAEPAGNAEAFRQTPSLASPGCCNFATSSFKYFQVASMTGS